MMCRIRFSSAAGRVGARVEFVRNLQLYVCTSWYSYLKSRTIEGSSDSEFELPL
jgi:hypothetical protein